MRNRFRGLQIIMLPSTNKDYFVFVPAFNVANTLVAVLQKIPDSVWKRACVLVIDDGSVDGTHETFDEYVAGLDDGDEKKRSLRYMRFEQNRGYGAVVKKGLAEALHAKSRFVACLHGDAQYPANQLGEFFDCLEKHDTLALVQGSRHLTRGGAKAGKMPLHKRLGGKFLTKVENIAFRQKLTDRHSGYIVYSAEFLKTVNLEKLSPSFDIDLELIAIADARGLALAELPIPTRYAEEKSNLNVVTYGLRVLLQVGRRLCKRPS